MKNKSLTNKAGQVRELKRSDIRAMRSAQEILPEKLSNILPKRKPGQRGPQKKPKKISVTVRYSPEVVSYFKNTGEGWQNRIDIVLKGYIKRHQKSSKRTKQTKKVA